MHATCLSDARVPAPGKLTLGFFHGPGHTKLSQASVRAAAGGSNEGSANGYANGTAHAAQAPPRHAFTLLDPDEEAQLASESHAPGPHLLPGGHNAATAAAPAPTGARPELGSRGADRGAEPLDAQALPLLTGLGSAGLGLAAPLVGARLSGEARLEPHALARPCGDSTHSDPAATAQQHARAGGGAHTPDQLPDPGLAHLPPVPLGAAQAAAGGARAAAASSGLGLGHAPDVLDPMRLPARSGAAAPTPAQQPDQACRPAGGSALAAAAATGAGDPPLGAAPSLGRERSASLPVTVSVAALAPAFSADAEQQLGAVAHAAPAAASGADAAGGSGRALAETSRVSSASTTLIVPPDFAAGGGGGPDGHGSPEKQFRAVVDLAADFSQAGLREPPSLRGAARRSTSDEEERIAQASPHVASP